MLLSSLARYVDELLRDSPLLFPITNEERAALAQQLLEEDSKSLVGTN